jgi:hypothetical protein
MSMPVNMIMQQIAQQKREAFALTGHGQKSFIKTKSSRIAIISTGTGGHWSLVSLTPVATLVTEK